MREKRCVMIVEADILVRHPLAEYLRECGYLVVEASSADEARRLLASDFSIEIVLADANAPGEGGFAFAAWMRANHPAIDVILAGSVEKEAKKAGDICEDGPALSKPYDHSLVLAQIQRLTAARDRGRRGG